MSQSAFSKTLSLNDTGETGAHMGGILIPKTELTIFPKLDTAKKNPRVVIPMKDRNNRNWNLSFIYYNNANFDGTRDEYRLTGLTEFITSNGLKAGDKITVSRLDEGAYHLDFEKADPSAPAEPTQIYFGLVANGANTSSKISHDHMMRPAARIIQTIGRHLIKDPQAAVMELVKNSYDADATNVHIRFHLGLDADAKHVMRISIEDDGGGMTYDQVTQSWLVPATPDKLNRLISPKGRQLQGNKGIGRFAAFMLGDQIFLTTISASSTMETSLILQASDFRKVQFLDQVQVIVDTREAAKAAKLGTNFEMTSREGDETFRQWEKGDFSKLRTDLRRMLFPFRTRNDEFKIWAEYRGFANFGQPDGIEEIEPLPIFEFFDYRIKAEVSADGKVTGTFSSPLVIGNSEEALSVRISELPGKSCGHLVIDLRVVDRETAALQDLLDRSLAAEDSLTGISRAQLKRLLDDACGVSVYRGDFRIRPYGDSGNDWLELDSKRINNPSVCIGNNQVFGTVAIETESQSHLQEKSDRDGLRVDEHYDRLRHIISSLIEELQRRRYEIRRSVGRILKKPRVTEMLAELKDFEKPFNRINQILIDEGIDAKKIERVRDVLRQDSEGRQQIIAKLEESIAIYQGQATLGKMVGVLLHEGSRSLGILRNQGKRMPGWLAQLLSSPNERVYEEVKEGLEGIVSAAESITKLFDKIHPLGIRSRGTAHDVVLIKQIHYVTRAFSEELAGIEVTIEVPADFKIKAWDQDLKTIFLNLVENSIYWINQKKPPSPNIGFKLIANAEGARLEITDNGPGIPREHIQSESIFEPVFSLKGGHGYGLGLPIAGEAAARNGFELKAIHDNAGAHFILDFSPASKDQLIMRKYLVLEDNQQYVDQTYKPYQRDSIATGSPCELVFVKTVEEAKQQLAFGRFNGAILDLRLSNTGQAEGNEIARQVHRDHFMPIAVVTGFEDELEPEMRQMADGVSSFVRVFKKSDMISLVFDFLFKVEQSGVLQIVGPGGEMNKLLSEIFWKHLGPFLAQWEGQTLTPADRQRLLRHAVSHMLGALQSNMLGTWDHYLPGEVYIWPPICPNEMTGDIYVQLDSGGRENGVYFLLVTPACDLASKSTPGATWHFVKIRPFTDFPNESKAANLVAKKEHRYHVLPPSAAYLGGVVDFASITCFAATEVNTLFSRKGTVIEPYWREIVARLGAWLSRQGTPEINKDNLLSLIRKQWPTQTATK